MEGSKHPSEVKMTKFCKLVPCIASIGEFKDNVGDRPRTVLSTILTGFDEVSDSPKLAPFAKFQGLLFKVEGSRMLFHRLCDIRLCQELPEVERFQKRKVPLFSF